MDSLLMNGPHGLKEWHLLIMRETWEQEHKQGTVNVFAQS